MQFAVRTEELYLKTPEHVSKLTYKIVVKSLEKISGISILFNFVPRAFDQKCLQVGYNSEIVWR